MPEYNVTASISLTCNIDVEADNEKLAEEEAMGYFDNSANFESDCYRNIYVMDTTINDVNENNQPFAVKPKLSLTNRP